MFFFEGSKNKLGVCWEVGSLGRWGIKLTLTARSRKPEQQYSRCVKNCWKSYIKIQKNTTKIPMKAEFFLILDLLKVVA